jgi:hypothetical protein
MICAGLIIVGQATILFEKDTLVAFGVIFTAVVGLLNLGYSFRNNRRASYVVSVTATRLHWIGEVRDRLSQYVALLHEYYVIPPDSVERRRRIFTQIVQHRMLLRLQLAPEVASLDEHFQTQIESVFKAATALPPAEVEARLEILISVGQKFLWEEWLKVKREAIHGDPYDKFLHRIKRWLNSSCP